jgi:hypothetical protein
LFGPGGYILIIGAQAFPISSRNSTAGIAHLLRKVGARRLLITRASTGALADAVHAELSLSEHTLLLEELPAFGEIFPRLAHETAADPFDPIPLPSREAFVDDCLAFMHSSGSTVCLKYCHQTAQSGLSPLCFRAFPNQSRGLLDFCIVWAWTKPSSVIRASISVRNHLIIDFMGGA